MATRNAHSAPQIEAAAINLLVDIDRLVGERAALTPIHSDASLGGQPYSTTSVLVDDVYLGGTNQPSHPNLFETVTELDNQTELTTVEILADFNLSRLSALLSTLLFTLVGVLLHRFLAKM